MSYISGVETKRRPIVVGSTIHRIFASTKFQEYYPFPESVFLNTDKVGVAFGCGIQRAALWAKLYH